jgi:phosphatidylglycerophosphatase A
MMLAKLIATCLGIGYLRKGAGTVAALFCCIIWYTTLNFTIDNIVRIVIVICIFIAGTWSAGKVESEWGHDSNRVVVDEVLGMCITLLFVPLNFITIASGLVLFRFFDILKPLFIRKAEQLPKGWGVMFDDLLAGIYANLVLHLLVWMNII